MTSLRDKQYDFLVKYGYGLLYSQDTHKITVDALYALINGPGIPIEGLTIVEETPQRSDKRYRITKNISPIECVLEFSTVQGKKRLSIVLNIQGQDTITCQWSVDNGECVYRLLHSFDTIGKKYRDFIARAEKREKISTLARDSIKTWITAILQDSPYSYCTEEMVTKMVLYIQLKNKRQLKIDIQYKSFQETMPELLQTIQQYEHMLNNEKFNVSIMQSSPHTKWIKGTGQKG
ncbi:MAG: hypothetical protein LBT14_06200 [Treponema sp.]|jgi:hypothetical protein|nr:hypothetical protein [Treponema sp.]